MFPGADIGRETPQYPESHSDLRYCCCGRFDFLLEDFQSDSLRLAMGDIINFKGIGPEYVGTASGLVATIQLIGAVVLPSYVLIPIASGNFNTLFILAAACMAISAVLGYLAHSN